MEKQIISSSSPSLQEVQKLFEKWRQSRKGRQPIPDHLWQAAARLSKHYSVNQIARILRLNHTTLKEWVEISMQSRSEFVELQFPETLSSIQWTVEMEKSNGTKLRMSCQGGGIQALVEMGKTFCGHDR